MLVALMALGLATDGAFARGKGGGGGGRSGGARSGGHHQHHGHGGTRVFLGAGVVAGPALWPWWDYPAYAAPGAPVQYIEKADDAADRDWFYCAGSNAYFPYVGECAGGWQRVPSQPQ